MEKKESNSTTSVYAKDESKKWEQLVVYKEHCVCNSYIDTHPF